MALAVISLFGLTACKPKTPPKGELTLSAVNTKDGYLAQSAMDGDISTGWIGSKKASESNFQVFDVDFGEKKTFSKITLNDEFTDGYTNRPPEFTLSTVTYGEGNTSSIGDGTVAGALSGAAEGQSWKTEVIPTEDNAQWLWLSLYESTVVKKLEINNEMNNSVPVSYEIYYSETAHNHRKEEEYTDVSTYTLLDKKTDNEENIIEIELENTITVRDVFIKIYSQENEGVAVVASIDEVFFYGETPEGYYENHQPERFTFMGSNDGKTYDIIKEVSGNYETIWTCTLEKSVSYRYIRYIVFTEYNNNYPSIGELSFE